MARLSVFNHITLDGYFTDAHGDMRWAHARTDDEWAAYTSENVKQPSATMLFGRKTYQMMAGFWPTAQAIEQMPDVADAMNRSSKIVFSRTLTDATWSNTRVSKVGPVEEVRRLKKESASDLLIMGSGTIVAQLAGERLIDTYDLVLNPIALGAGRSLFEGLGRQLDLTLTRTRSFQNGNVVLTYSQG
jgi:dihydrofolate reductase